MTRVDGAVVAAARAVLSARFRLHGRDPALGLDCVGVVAVAARGAGYDGAVPTGYALHGGDVARVRAQFDAAGFVPAATVRPGAIALFDSGLGQLHLAVIVPGGIVHADAMLRRVVERPGMPPWPLLGCWHVRDSRED
ncbi:peptidoglycan endopeptidase [Sphingomonas sp. TREG-RG-20F-R18-01]|uniref:peptidoglycan endopeptidase n=1 Tax=Sphingomonas sp. TREG-RG-20F-R18-01 TaxID=2914982 RepID=UPI001F57D882|nr:peptidoglycan endopeptidase [Sphingomonas sp. TREG-RG-20F-R18-01]